MNSKYEKEGLKQDKNAKRMIWWMSLKTVGWNAKRMIWWMSLKTVGWNAKGWYDECIKTVGWNAKGWYDEWV